MTRIRPKREGVDNIPGFYRVLQKNGYKYEFRPPGERKPVFVPGNPTKAEAKRWRAKYLGLEEHERTIITQEKFHGYALAWIETTPTLKVRTRKLYKSNLELHLKKLHNLKLHEIDADKIRGLVITPMTEAGYAGNTISNVLKVISSVLGYALDKKKIVANPMNNLSKRDRPKIKKKRKRILKPEEAAKFIGLAGDYKALFAVMLFGGLRISEVLGLCWDDVDLKAGKIHVWRQLAYSKDEVTIGEHWTELKGEDEDVKERYVEIAGVLKALLVAHRGDRIVHRDDFVFWTSNATPYSQRNIQRVFKSTVELAGLDNEPVLTPHQCRHNFASALIASGADVGFVADQLGHADPNVTLAIYRHEFRAAREAGSGAAAIDRIYSEAMAK
ncbi:MAG TPA: tyrosine-type recombinase/integrase [Gemmatimonadaceae bacterium]|jgi:integrase|nr:tyrosine-type recombinase/integrase [Gemmatimonadaceae bacterium]